MAHASDSPRPAEPAVPVEPPSGALQVGQIIGRYLVLRKLGEGGMGEVWEAEHNEIGFRAAIKVLHPEYSLQPEIARRFLNEARAVNIVQHPGIVKIFDFGRLPDRTAYIIMEFLEGHLLAERMHQRGRVPEAELVPIARQIASILAAAHKANVIHRDLKPANVMLVPDPAAVGGERAKLLDFGLAKVVAEIDNDSGSSTHLRTRTGVVMGTALYMAPEQCRGAPQINGQADVYALAVMLYEALCGRPPFSAKSEGELVSMHLRDQPPPLRRFEPSVSSELNKLIHSMLQKDPAARPTMAQVEEALAALVPVLASKPRTAISLPPALRRPRARWPMLAGGVVAGVLLGVLAAWVQRRMTAGEQEHASWAKVDSGTKYHLRTIYGWPNDLWAAGDSGTSLHWDGQRWSGVPTPTTQSLRGLWGASRDALWAAGGHGTILRWNGMAWSDVQSGETVDLRGVWGSSGKDLWAVGKQGIILHGDGERWTSVPSGVKEDLRGVWGSGDKDVWAVGEYGAVVHWNGVAWSKVDAGTQNWLQKVWGNGPNDVWLVGNESTLLHWDGKRWEKHEYDPGNELSAAWGDGSGRVWIGGNEGVLLRVEESRLQRLRSPTMSWLYGMWGVTEPGKEPDLWAVGGYGVILRYQH